MPDSFCQVRVHRPANEVLIRNERILDLEDQVKSLVAQVNKANAEKERMWERLWDARVDA